VTVVKVDGSKDLKDFHVAVDFFSFSFAIGEGGYMKW
jgi:hypothetical protein